tara:strand:+ start:1181 stop:1387 length:207 start_codon:yes stop_codon:yes gene_type:complete
MIKKKKKPIKTKKATAKKKPTMYGMTSQDIINKTKKKPKKATAKKKPAVYGMTSQDIINKTKKKKLKT